jgi:hypothetical protein
LLPAVGGLSPTQTFRLCRSRQDSIWTVTRYRTARAQRTPAKTAWAGSRACAHRLASNGRAGRVAERLNAPVLKTGRRATPASGVRISPLPYVLCRLRPSERVSGAPHPLGRPLTWNARPWRHQVNVRRRLGILPYACTCAAGLAHTFAAPYRVVERDSRRWAFGRRYGDICRPVLAHAQSPHTYSVPSSDTTMRS